MTADPAPATSPNSLDRRRPARTRWAVAVVLLLLSSVGTQSILLICSLPDASFAIEPDYERRALRHDDEARQRFQDLALGWSASVRRCEGEGERLRLALSVADADGLPLRGLDVQVTAFHLARSNDRVETTLQEEGDGRYAAALDLPRPGLHEFRLVARRGGDRFTAVLRAVATAASP